MQDHPTDFNQELRRCARCHALKPFLLTEPNRKVCADCSRKVREYKRRHKPLKLSKEDLAHIEKERQQRNKLLQAKYGTTSPDCLTWRMMFENGQRADFYYNHLEVCRSCGHYFATHKPDSLNLNNTKKGEEFEELKGYEEAFKPDNTTPEDYVYSPNGVFPTTRICNTCGTPLNEKGKCLICEPE